MFCKGKSRGGWEGLGPAGQRAEVSIFYIIYFYIFSHAMEIERGQKNTKRRIVSLDELLYTVEVLLQPLEFLQHVVVDGGVAEDTDTRWQFLHQLAHRFALATRRST